MLSHQHGAFCNQTTHVAQHTESTPRYNLAARCKPLQESCVKETTFLWPQGALCTRQSQPHLRGEQLLLLLCHASGCLGSNGKQQQRMTDNRGACISSSCTASTRGSLELTSNRGVPTTTELSSGAPGGQRADRDPAVCPGGQQNLGVHLQERGQRAEGGAHPLCSALGRTQLQHWAQLLNSMQTENCRDSGSLEHLPVGKG